MSQPPVPHKKMDRKKLMIYAGVAGALLLVVMLMRRSQGAASGSPLSTTTPAPGTPQDGLSGSPGSGSGVDNASQLASFENALLNQLPQAITSGIQAGYANGQQAAGAAGTAAVDNATASPIADTLTALAAFGAATGVFGKGSGGQQVGGGQQSPSSPSKTNATAAVHPAYGGVGGRTVGGGGGYRQIPGSNMYIGAGGKVKTAAQAGIKKKHH